jgi:RTX calcium-binding nonapeptide repeat (4 copies)
MAVVVTFLIGCAFLLLVVGCAGVRSGASKKGQKHVEATKKEQTCSPEATASEEARCEGTQSNDLAKISASASPASAGFYTTNDLPGCPKGGLLLGTDKADKLAGQAGEDEVRGLGGSDDIYGRLANDVIYGGPGADGVASTPSSDSGDDVYYGGDGKDWIMGGMGSGKDVIYGGDGNDNILTIYDHQPDKLYCGKGKDAYDADKYDYVDSSCELEMGANA